MRPFLWNERFGPSIRYTSCWEGGAFGGVPVCQFLKEGQSGGHQTVEGGVVGRLAWSPRVQRVTLRGAVWAALRWSSIRMVTGRRTFVHSTGLKFRMSAWVRDYGELPRSDDWSTPSRSSHPHGPKELHHRVTAQASSLRFPSGNQQNGSKEGRLEK